MKPLISVLMSAYNHENYVQDTIKSIINQTYENIELIIFDDGSKDSTFQKIMEMKEECEKRFVRVVFETKENEGTCKTINKLLSMAQGEYIALSSSDDMYKPSCFEKELNFLSENPDYALCTGDNEFIDNENRVCYWDKDRNIVYDEKLAVYKTFGEAQSKKLRVNLNSDEFGRYDVFYRCNPLTNGFLIKKFIFDNFKYTPEAPIEDWFLMLQISKYYKMKFFDEVLYSYRWHNSNTVKNEEKLKKLTVQTREYENKILSRIDKSKVRKEVIDVINNGVVYRKYFSLFKIFEIIFMYRATDSNRHRVFTLFGKKIFEYSEY